MKVLRHYTQKQVMKLGDCNAAVSIRFSLYKYPLINCEVMIMNKELYILPEDQRPKWLKYPHSFCRIIDQSLIHVTPWHILEAQRAALLFKGLENRYPSRKLFPFAYRQDNDDVACWSMGMGEKVFVIHDFASSGWEDEMTFDDVWAWFRSAVEETIVWD